MGGCGRRSSPAIGSRAPACSGRAWGAQREVSRAARSQGVEVAAALGAAAARGIHQVQICASPRQRVSSRQSPCPAGVRAPDHAHRHAHHACRRGSAPSSRTRGERIARLRWRAQKRGSVKQRTPRHSALIQAAVCDAGRLAKRAHSGEDPCVRHRGRSGEATIENALERSGELERGGRSCDRDQHVWPWQPPELLEEVRERAD